MEKIKIRCRLCNKELESHPSQLRTCGCPNMTSIRVDKISAIDLSEVIIVSGYNTKNTNKTDHISNLDLQFQEDRRKRKVRKLDFEIR